MNQSLIKPINPQNIGSSLNYFLTSKEPYKKYTFYDLSKSDVKVINKVNSYILQVYNDFLNIPISLNNYSTQTNMLPGDVVKIENRNYIIVSFQNDNYVTWPRSSESDRSKFFSSNTMRTFEVIRPDTSNIKPGTLESINAISMESLTIDPNAKAGLTEDFQTFTSFTDAKDLSDGFLQIGDLVFLVDPTQLSFNTQNGYQYFPTLRTQGNPKIPTIQQVKNVSLSLIFPNENSINNQLLNLYAMFKRAPFVNIRNTDICSFFKDICFGKDWPYQWLSVALESIQIQSVEGFPNTLQAIITILPFDNRIISNGFESLLSFNDVKEQQSVLYKNRELENLIYKAENKFNNQSIVPEKFEDIIPANIKKSPDFRQSLPFRAFYQSLINGRDYVKDENGDIVNVSSVTNVNLDKGHNIVKYRPEDKGSMLNEYKAEANNIPITLKYKYINGDFRSISKQLSEARTDYQSKVIEELTRIKSSIENKDGLVQEIVNSFVTTDDFFKQVNYTLEQKNNTVKELLSRHGITLDTSSDDYKPIEGITDLIFRGFLEKTGIESVGAALRDANKVAQGNFKVDDQTDYLGLMTNVITYTNVSDYVVNNNGVVTAQGYLDGIWEYIKDSDNRKAKFSAFLHDMRITFLNEIGAVESKTIVTVDPNSPDYFKVISLPLEEKKIVIDNKKDVITSWSLVFSNKFVPINIQAFKYPFYQHMGSEDAVMSLSITSTSEKTITDLKTELSLLSERLYESVKIINYTAPELITYLDGNIDVDVPVNNIFKVFGVSKVLFDSSSSNNINGQPGSWKTNINLTQSSVDITKYHAIDKVPSFNNIRDIIARLLASIERNGDSYIVKKYQTRSNPTSNAAQNTPAYEDTDLENILKLRFISEYGGPLVTEINEIRKEGQRYLNDRKRISKDVAYNAGYPYPGVVGSNYSVTNRDLDAKDKNILIGENLATKVETDSKAYEQMKDAINPLFKDENDEHATTTLNDLCNTFPEFKKVINFMLGKVDSIFKQEYESLLTILRPNKSFVQSLSENISSNFINAIGLNSVKSSAFTAATLIFGPIGFGVGLIGKGAFAAVSSVVVGGINSVVEQGEKAIINTFQNVFTDIMDNYNNSIIHDLSNKIIKDPIIRDRLLNENIVGSDIKTLFEKSVAESRINCYNDFDVPYLKDSIALSPDFYLYNDVLSDSEIQSYFTESVRRYAKMGKLTLLMTLVESEEVLTKYDELIKQNAEIDTNIKKNVESILTTNLKSDIASSIKHLQDMQVNVSRCATNIDEQNIIKRKEVIDDYVKTYPREEALNKDDWDNVYDSYMTSLKKPTKGLSVGNLNAKKYNLIVAARMKVLLEIFQIYTVINNYMSDQLGSNEDGFFSVNVKTLDSSELLNITKNKSESDSLKAMHNHIKLILNSAQDITTDSLKSESFGSQNSKNEIKSLKDNFGKNNGLATFNSGKNLSLPDIKNIQVTIYNKIGFYIRLNTFINEIEKSQFDFGTLNFDTIPELKFLEFWNFRTVEENQRKITLLKEFFDGYSNKKDTTIKMFPTFKIFFIEEDNGIFRNLDDYYTHNAIQSIEIVSNKNSSSKTAVLRLSNVTNSLTDQLSLLREKKDLLGKSTDFKEPDNIFFGTLDIKPGTQIVIKLGYAPFDNLLTTVFQGRIMEMNPGPVCEMVCQSFSAQLNHHIVSEKFGMLSTVKEHGDVVSAMLDTIPGLEKLGKIPIFGVTTQDFSGKNLRNVRGKFADKFLLGNILGNVSSLLFSQNNPRDDNIFLPYSFESSVYNKPTFDWVIFDQSVWEAINELTLYHRNVIPTIRSFNDDPISDRNDLRETIVIGDKSGYFKFSDAFSLSGLNIKDVEQSLEEFGRIRSIFKSNTYPFVPSNGESVTFPGGNTALVSQRWDLKSEYNKLFDYLQNETNALVLSAIILNNTSAVKSKVKITELIKSTIFNNKFLPSVETRIVNNLIKFSRFSNIDPSDLSTYNFTEEVNLNEQAKTFAKITKALYKVDKLIPIEITKEEYYQIKAQIPNTDKGLANNPQYKKIQQHYLITDTSDIISNNITLTTDFANTVNLYYYGEPKLKTATINQLDWNKDLNLWSIKAFGDQRDEHTRVLNSFQKNIDTNWFDTATAVNGFFSGYKRFNNREDGISKITSKSKEKAYDLDVPNWNIFPSFVVVAVNLLKREVERMYQGTIEIVGNPQIQPYDILHIQDYTNDMHGSIEVEEVIHVFTPDGGFKTVITPNLMTYDRDPVQLQDVQIINQIYDYANTRRNWRIGIGVGAAAVLGAAGIASTVVGAPVVGAGLAVTGGTSLWNGLVNSYKKYHRFLYDQMGNILGRDCINFTSLIYHGVPYVAGFEGVDYTSLKTLMNHNVLGVKNPIARYAAFKDPLAANITTDFDPNNLSILGQFFGNFSLDGTRLTGGQL